MSIDYFLPHNIRYKSFEQIHFESHLCRTSCKTYIIIFLAISLMLSEVLEENSILGITIISREMPEFLFS